MRNTPNSDESIVSRFGEDRLDSVKIYIQYGLENCTMKLKETISTHYISAYRPLKNAERKHRIK